MQEYRIVPRVWKYDSKIYRYQSRATFEDNAQRMPIEEFRHEYREVSEWKSLEEDA